MKIYVQSTVFLPTPAPGAGAVEYLVWRFAKGLAELGHEVWLFCRHGSLTAGPGSRLVMVEPQNHDQSPQAVELLMAMEMLKCAGKAGPPDVLFDHSMTQQAQRLLDCPAVTMSHGMAPLMPYAKNYVFVSQHHGRLHKIENPRALHLDVDVPAAIDPTQERAGLLWAGRILPYKQPHIALNVARATGIPLSIYGPIGDYDYFQSAGLTDGYLGEVSSLAVSDAMARARALLFTSDDTEPAGLVMLEAMAQNYPVLAFDHGANREYLPPDYRYATPEDMVAALLDDGVKDGGWEWVIDNGFTVDDMIRRALDTLADAAKGVTW